MSNGPVHSVHIYDEHSSLIQRLCGVVSSGLKVGNSVLIVATAQHRDQLVKELLDAGVDVSQHAREGRFCMYDAEETLATFMLNGRPDRTLFMQSVGSLLQQAKKKACSKDQGLTVFGEMVAVLWERGDRQAALELEALWNEVLSSSPFHLHCAYPQWNFNTAADSAAIIEVCNIHSHILVH